ncbi:MAG TPA: sulfatase [Acidimicrobiales bacterium]|nr:sulfatase [Acidimicrobiales bacterium]
MSADAPNILLVVMDTARADGFEPYGAAPGDTPVVAQLASSGAAQPHVFATANWTVPSHASMFSGLQPGAVGLGQAPDGPLGCRRFLEALGPRLLPQVLRSAGYATAGASTNMWITDKSGFDIGFDTFEVVESEHRARISDPHWRERLRWDRDAVRATHDDGAAQVASTLAGWAAGAQRPFFWFVNLTECHSPYLPPRPYNDLGPIQRLRAGEEARRYLTLGEIWKACLGAMVVPEAALARMRHLYRRSIRYMDDWLGRILETLEQHGLLEDTVVVVTSDHGENLGESNLLGHAFSLDDRLVRVPFVTSHAELLDGRPGGLGARSLADLPAALCALAGVDDHPYRDVGSVGGVAVAELEALVRPDDPRVVEVAEKQWKLDDAGMARLTSSQWCATDGRTKLVCTEGHHQVYDLMADPLEVHPLEVDASGTVAGVASDTVAALRRVGERVMARQWEGLESAAQAPTKVEVAPDELEALEEQMRRLGYL